MKREVVIHRRAEQDLRRYYRRLFHRAPVTVTRRYNRFTNAILGLADNADIWAEAPENKRLGTTLKILPFGKYPNKFRVYYLIADDVVHVLRITRGQCRALRPRDLTDLD